MRCRRADGTRLFLLPLVLRACKLRLVFCSDVNENRKQTPSWLCFSRQYAYGQLREMWPLNRAPAETSFRRDSMSLVWGGTSVSSCQCSSRLVAIGQCAGVRNSACDNHRSVEKRNSRGATAYATTCVPR